MCSGTKELKAAEADLKVLRSISDGPAISTQISTNKPVDVKDVQARISQDWIKDAVIYEIFPRQYSAEGNFNGITKDLDRLQKLGVTVLWLMPIHPIGEAKRKGTIGSPYAVKDFYAINP
ncbi:MAG: hypothetical protein KF685_08935, partial [Acidobacteria bacterium]|nr:hypothetical protein [Acidobacteriota bacterium]